MEDKVFKIEKVIHRVDKYDVYAIRKYARVKLTDSSYEGATIDIERVANTHRFASFFDMLNHHNWINYDVEPESVDKLEYPLVKFDFYS